MRALAMTVLGAAILCATAAADTVRSPIAGREGWDDRSPEWSANGSEIFFHSYYSPPKDAGAVRTAVVRRDGSGYQRLDPAEGVPQPSPDGKKLLIERGEDPDDFGGFAAHAVYVRDVVTGRERRLTSPGGDELAGGWSPDGARILITRRITRRTR